MACDADCETISTPILSYPIIFFMEYPVTGPLKCFFMVHTLREWSENLRASSVNFDLLRMKINEYLSHVVQSKFASKLDVCSANYIAQNIQEIQ